MKSKTPFRSRLFYPREIASRVIAAVLGGYVFAATFTGFLAVALPLPRAEAVVLATLLSFAMYACAILWVFAVQSAARAWTGLMSSAVFWGGALLLIKWISDA